MIESSEGTHSGSEFAVGQTLPFSGRKWASAETWMSEV